MINSNPKLYLETKEPRKTTHYGRNEAEIPTNCIVTPAK